MQRMQKKEKKALWKKGLSFLLSGGLLVSGTVPSLAATEKRTEVPIQISSFNSSSSRPSGRQSHSPKTENAVKGLLTENGEAKAELYMGEGGNEIDATALKEMQDIVAMISGAVLPQTDVLKEEGMQIVLATPDTFPDLSTLFAEDLAWIGESDGFAVRQDGNKIYIFGTTSKGMLNGVYDFLEENCGILWTRGVEELGTLYTEQPTLTVTSCDYREKSPFALRGWNACGLGSTGKHHTDTNTRWFEGRTKLNIRPGGLRGDIDTTELDGYLYTVNGQQPFGANTTLYLDKYFDEHPEYFMTEADGTPKRNQYGSNLNFYSMEAADALAQELVDFARKNKLEYVGHSIQDTQYFCMVENGIDLASQPFTAENGVTVTPDQDNYKSTVFFNFLNRAARKVKELAPDLKIVSLAYIYCEYAPAVQIEDNSVIQFAPIFSDDHLPIKTSPSNASVKKNLEDWAGMTKNIVVYNYYACLPCEIYSRPIADKVQQDLMWYAELGVLGLTPEGGVDSAPGNPNYNAWSMNHLYYWLMNQLFWDPYADLDVLTIKFCDAAYGEASGYMQEYYRLIQEGWDKFDDYVWYTSGGDTYIKKFIIDAGVAEDAQKALDNGYEVADELAKKRIDLIRKTFNEQLSKWANFVPEDGVAYYCDEGKQALISDENLSVTQGPWSKIQPLTVFKGQELEDCFRDLEVRLMWDKDNVYIAYKIPNEKIGTQEDPYTNISPLLSDGSWWQGATPEFMETYLVGNMTNMSEYSAYYTDVIDQQIQFDVGPVHHPGPYAWESHSRVVSDGEPSERYWMNVLVVPFETLGVNYKNAVLGGTFIANIFDKSYSDSIYYGWCGANVWSTSSFRRIEMVGGPGEAGDADKQALQELYSANKDKANDGYTDGSWAAFQKALADAKSVLEDPNATQAEVDGAASSLSAAISGLTRAETSAADKSKLQRLYDSLRDQVNSGFTASSWENFESARRNAKEVLDLADATQKAVDDAYNRLLKAMVQLEKAGSSQTQDSYLIVALANEGGSISPSGRISVEAGRDKTFTITASSGYHIQKVLVDGKEVRLEKGRYTFEAVDANHSIEAFFTKEKSNVDTGAPANSTSMPAALMGAAVLSAAILFKCSKR